MNYTGWSGFVDGAVPGLLPGRRPASGTDARDVPPVRTAGGSLRSSSGGTPSEPVHPEGMLRPVRPFQGD